MDIHIQRFGFCFSTMLLPCFICKKKKKTTVNGLFKSVFMIKYEMHIQQIFLNEVRDTNLTTMILTMINHATLF